MADLNKIKALINNDAARMRVQRLNKKGEAAVKGATDGDEKLIAYREYVDNFYNLKARFPNWEKHLDKPIEYSSFVLDYNEEVYKMIAQSAEDYKGKSPIEVYALKLHGVNLRSIGILEEKLAELHPGTVWANVNYVEQHIVEAYQLLRQDFPDDEEYDNIFSPKEEMILF